MFGINELDVIIVLLSFCLTQLILLPAAFQVVQKLHIKIEKL
ncbi:Uncharacterised protein [uncultured archaeon]|nr:Uncharacterised protein [uncultured archaeon]